VSNATPGSNTPCKYRVDIEYVGRVWKSCSQATLELTGVFVALLVKKAVKRLNGRRYELTTADINTGCL